MDEITSTVRNRYAAAARQAARRTQATDGGDCCAHGSCGSRHYAAGERDELPEQAVLASVGCGNPVAVAELADGEAVLDLGSGGGIDVLLSARRVGPTGRAYGVDFTEEMLELARRNAEQAGVANAEFLRGSIEDLPLPPATVDVVISNCVINLSTDKQAVFGEMHRVLRPGGRIGISDIVASSDLSPQQRAERGSYVGCIAGALSFDEYERGLEDAGFTEVEITPTHAVAEGMFSAVVKATRSAVDRTQLEQGAGLEHTR